MADTKLIFCGNSELYLKKELCRDSDETNGAPAFRIPSLVNCRGTLVAAIDRASSGADWGYIEIAVRRSSDDGRTWSPIQSILVPPARETKVGDEYYKSSFYIDPCMTVAKNGDIVMLVTFFPECKGIHNKKLLDRKKAAFAQAGGRMCPVLYDKAGRFYTVREDGRLYNNKNEKTDFCLKTDLQAPYYETGDLYRGDEMMGNIYLNGAMGKNEMHTVLAFGAPIKAPKRSYIFMTRSSDAGVTWSAPKDITADILLKEDGTFLGVAPGSGIALDDGRLVMTVYSLKGAAAIYSDDGGETWKRDTSQKYIGAQGEWQCVQAPDGSLIGLARQNRSGKTPMVMSHNRGVTWEKKGSTGILACKCQKSFIRYDDEYVLCSHTAKSGRRDGVLSVGRFIMKKGKAAGIKWIRHLPVNQGFFAYSSLAVLNDGSVGVLYEDEPSSHIVFQTFSKADLFGENP